MKNILFIIAITAVNLVQGQNVGLGVSIPVERLEVNGKLRTDAMTISSGGSTFDFLFKSDAQGTIGTRKGHGGLAFNYIICVIGLYPSAGSGTNEGPFLGDIRMFSGNFAPNGWKLCNGEHLSKTSNAALYSIVGDTFGSTGTTFALPDLRGLVPVGAGTSPSGNSWSRGQKSN